MKDIKTIENILSNAPRAKLDPEFKAALGAQFKDYHGQKNISYFFSRRFIMPFVLILAVGILLALNFFNSRKTPLDLLLPVKVSAQEIIQRSREVFLKPGFIYHQKSTQYLEGKKTVTYDLWEDMDTPMLRNHVIYHDTGREIWQWFDQDARYDADSQEKVIRKDIYIYDELNPRGQKLGNMADLAARFDELLTEGTLTAKEGKMNEKDVYVIYDERNSDEKYWDILMFDKITFRLIRTEKYTGQGQERHASQIVEYETIENLKRTDENINNLFLTSPVLISDYKVISRNYYMDGRSNEDYIPEDSLKPIPSNIIDLSLESTVSAELMLLETPTPY
jgi:hypothetical protein